MSRLLHVENLSVLPRAGNSRQPLVNDVSFSIGSGEAVTLIGLSGSGKTLLTRGLTSLFDTQENLALTGSVLFERQQLIGTPERELRVIRRTGIRYVFQDPQLALNPVRTIGSQMKHAAGGRRKADWQDALRRVGLDATNVILRAFPHQLSVGMAQRVTIAMALVARPALIIADEPTSALDAEAKNGIVDLLCSLRGNTGLSLLVTTHDLDVAERVGDRVLVMYGGQVIEAAASKAFFRNPLHPFSKMLLGARAEGTDQSPGGDSFQVTHTGCVFSLSCPLVREECRRHQPPLAVAVQHHDVRCPFWK